MLMIFIYIIFYCPFSLNIAMANFFFFFQALMARPSEGTEVNRNTGIISGVLVTIGDLARVVCKLLLYYMHQNVFYAFVFD